VYQKSGLSAIKKQVKVGETNQSSIVVEEGLDTGEKVLLSVPEGADKLKLKTL
jgi:multidrug efflux pump subunit AcrA (membrane-fusion protein)